MVTGETRPIAPNTNEDGSDNPEGRARNRRTELASKTARSLIAAGEARRKPDFLFLRTEAGVLHPDPSLNGPVCRLKFALLGSDGFVMFWLTFLFRGRECGMAWHQPGRISK
jgi:hypothetical protein